MAAPHRRCIACRRSAPKPTLHRLVAQERHIIPDPLAREPGRGAYLCGRTACTDLALRRDAALLRRALRLGGEAQVDRAAIASAVNGRWDRSGTTAPEE